MPGGGIEPPTRGFSIEMAINTYINAISCMSLKLVRAKVCFEFLNGLDQTLCLQPMAGHSLYTEPTRFGSSRYIYFNHVA